MKTWDLIVIGGGIIGLSLALEVRKRGAKVLVVERGEPGHEASRAAGGMLVECPLETKPALLELAKASARIYPEFAHEIEVESGMTVDLRDQGTILLDPERDDSELEDCGSAVEDLNQLEPNLLANGKRAFYLRERSVDPRALTAAAHQAAKNRGVDFSSRDAVIRVDIADGRACGVTTAKTAFAAQKIVNCAGAWAGQIEPRAFPTRPVKGQMLCLAMPSRTLIQHVIRSPKAYLIPRSDGRLLIGASVEEAGFDKRTDAAMIQEFRNAALELVPKVANAKILEDWAGLRPGTPDGLPILGGTSTPGYFVATGHFRDGILLAPITARIMADVVEDRPCGHDLRQFSAQRFA